MSIQIINRLISELGAEQVGASILLHEDGANVEIATCTEGNWLVKPDYLARLDAKKSRKAKAEAPADDQPADAPVLE